MSGAPPFDPVDRPPADGEDTAEVPPVASRIADPAPPWHTTELASRAGVVLPPGLWLVFLFVAAIGLLGGIAVAAATRAGSPGAVVASAAIGPDGGTLSFGHGSVRVPDGAVSAPVYVEVRRSVVKDRLRVAPPDGPLYVFEPNRLVAYTFGPSSVTFARPVAIVLPLNATGRSGTAFIAADNRILFLPGKVDPKAGTVTITVNDFRFGGGEAGAQ